MEIAAAAAAGDGTPPPLPPESGGENGGTGERPKRKMKSPYQLQVLEEAYAVDSYPSEAVRAELSEKIKLTDRQLQMWFCHRRLKDRKVVPQAAPPPVVKRAKKEEEMMLTSVPVVPVSEMMTAGSSSGGAYSRSGGERGRGVGRGGGGVMGKRYYEPVGPARQMLGLAPVGMVPPPAPQLSMAELRVIASVEAQLGEPLREDGPILGVEFDPLPPGAFGAPIVVAPHPKQPLQSYSGKHFERHEPKAIKTSAYMPGMEHYFVPSASSKKRKAAHMAHPQAGPRDPHEYQFLPEQPSIRSETYERMPQPHFYDSPVVTPIARVSSSPAGGHYMQGNEPVTPAYTFNGQLSTGTCLTQHRHYSSGSADYDNAPHSNSLANSGADAQFGTHQVLGTENLYLPADPSQGERKRKNEEARIQKEVEAHEKRIRKELEKQDILRRKREEQMRREMERHDRERRKEEERVLREKQREEERLLREQRREIERREKYLQKESLRTEKMRQKEEQRREKEAARLKAATERATARRIAKEYMELVEDERLELLELAASSKGLSSIITLDSEILQQLDMFRGMLHAFPPKSVQLKRPFPNLPWTQVEENIANFFMVWEFLITFADILGLWSFTMDEFLQSLHDYDSKLLGEIHVALLRSIIKDIEDVARTIAIAMGSNQNAAANPGGGHPKIVEGAYAWGFDIRNWQRHLNFITWPEILRQFAISAGLGPQLKRRTIERPYFRDDNEANGGKDVISTLRNGTAAENAAALMHERGYSNRRRSRHRLTPGTVKFAAFHVLSLEGSKGLTIIEVAEKIQKSGLRDLTTSKTPEASIAAALSRDTKLFERIAPSTYCVRPPFRKDPADADRILSGAREKIQVFQNGLSDSEEAEKDVDDVEEAERDEDSDCDVADDPEVDLATNTDAKLNKNILGSHELKDYSSPPASLLKEKSEVGITPGGCLRSGGKSPLILTMRKSNLTSVSDVPNCQEPSNADAEDIEIDESNFGATWVQGLSEGDYSDLSIDERLDALVALISVANEGNSVRAILEERLEAANSLKKQIWAETQLDKRRYKEEYTSKIPYPSFAGSNAEASQTNAAAEGSQTPTEIIDTKEGGNQISVMGDQFFDPQCQTNFNMSAERNLVGQEFLTNPESLSLQHGFAVEKSRSQLKSFIGHKAELQYVYRSLPLGQDRRRNKYWIFSTGPSPNDPGTGRIFFESKGGFWRILDTEEAFDSLVSALDTRGLRESHLHSMLQRVEPIFKVAVRRNKNHSKIGNSDEFLVKAGTGTRDMLASPDRQTEVDSPSSIPCGINSYSPDCSSSFRIEMGRNERERNAFAKRYNVFLKWMWKECYNSSVLCAMKYGKKRCPELLQTCHLCYNCYLAEERHCPSCHKTFKAVYNIEAIFSEHVYQCEMKQKVDSEWAYQGSDFSLPIGVQLLKAQLALIEVSIPKEALQPFWTDGYRKSWGVKLHSSTSSEDLLQLVTLLEHAVKRDYLSSNFETTNELLGFSAGVAENNTAINGQTPCLPWVPETIAAVALRLYDFDSSISYILDRKVENKEKDDGRFIMLPSRSTDIQDPSPNEIPEQVNYRREVTWLDFGSGRRGRGRGTRGRGGGRGRGRGGRGLRGTATYIIPDFKDEFVESYGKSTRKYTRRAVQPRGRGRKRGRRSVRSRQRSDGRFTVAKKAQLGSFTNVGVNIKQNRFEKSPRSSGGNEWGLRETSAQFVDENSGGSQSEDDGLYSGDEYDGQTTNYTINYGQNKPMGMLDDETDEDEEDVDGDEDEDGEEDVDGAQIRHMMMGVDVDDEDEEENIEDEDGDDIGGDVNGDEDDFSSEYSDE